MISPMSIQHHVCHVKGEIQGCSRATLRDLINAMKNCNCNVHALYYMSMSLLIDIHVCRSAQITSNSFSSSGFLKLSDIRAAGLVSADFIAFSLWKFFSVSCYRNRSVG